MEEVNALLYPTIYEGSQKDLPGQQKEYQI
jgi:hypothetical protein